jgi:hypothetical protein
MTAPLNVLIDVHAGEVMVIFNIDVRWWTLPPAQAKEIGAKLIEMAERIERAAEMDQGRPD